MTRAKKKSRKAPPASRKKAEKAPLEPEVAASDDTAPVDDELAIEADAALGDRDDDALLADPDLVIDPPLANGTTTNGAGEHGALADDAIAPLTEDASANAPVDLEQLLTGEDGAVAGAIEPARELSQSHLEGLLEALVFASDKPVKTNELARLASAPVRQVKEVMTALHAFHATRGIVLDEIAGGWLFRTNAQYAPFVRELAGGRPVKLSRAQIETLAIAAYRQPITRPEIDEIRGVDSGATLKLLLERDLLRILGKKDEPGRPLLYGTTAHFLEFFNMKSLKDLPTLREFTELSDESRKVAETELGEVLPDLHIPVDRPEAIAPEGGMLGESEGEAVAVDRDDDGDGDETTDSERDTLPITSAVDREEHEEHEETDGAYGPNEDEAHPAAPKVTDSDADEDA